MERFLPEKQKNTLFQAAYIKAIIENKKNLKQWNEYKDKYEEVIKNLQYYNEKHQHSIFLPVGSKAYIKGRLVHTNDVWVTLGCGWFIKTSCKKAVEICERRIKSANELIEKWEKESTLLENMRDFSKEKDAFESEETKEVIEPYDEDQEKDWKLKHREKEKQYRQQLKELKEKTGSANISTEKDIWEHLEALELQEELEDELNRLGCDTESSSEDDDSSESDLSNDSAVETTEPVKNSKPEQENEHLESKPKSIIVKDTSNSSRRKSVTFNLPPDDTSNESAPQVSIINENNALPEAVSDTVYENVSKPSLPLNGNELKRPMSKFKMNRK
ncbi:unconventional prefoldin RPB5 interactor 1 [Halyomorpha halys]|uniref:unconventional prefoldin RPB5 interactor 1 n=1 Tax=Halyomorpha halys TaxID=286706 RepID=UPI0006D50709|nr:unconventional prefoldin RPB5 interactor 1 [Halyomorpha halys]